MLYIRFNNEFIWLRFKIFREKKVNNVFTITGGAMIKNNSNIDRVLKKAINSNNVEFINVFIKPDQKITPKLTFGSLLEDLSPQLSRNEFYENIIIKSVNKEKNLTESN